MTGTPLHWAQEKIPSVDDDPVAEGDADSEEGDHRWAPESGTLPDPGPGVKGRAPGLYPRGLRQKDIE